MAEFIIHHKEAYNIYGTIADGAYFESALTLKQLVHFIKREYGFQGLRRLRGRLKRAKRKGTSSLEDDSLADTLLLNRAGENENHLTTKMFIKRFLTLRKK